MYIPKEYKRSAKYNEVDRLHVQKMHREGSSIHLISRTTGISRRMVQFILYPARLELAKKLYKQRRKDGRYYVRAKHTQAMRIHRSYKKLLENEKVLVS